LTLSFGGKELYLENEDPAPAFLAGYAIHEGDAVGEETGKSTCNCDGGEEEGEAPLVLPAGVPHGEIEGYALVVISKDLLLVEVCYHYFYKTVSVLFE
jgi:hypothetical protein